MILLHRSNIELAQHVLKTVALSEIQPVTTIIRSTNQIYCNLNTIGNKKCKTNQRTIGAMFSIIHRMTLQMIFPADGN